jgi:hypothetical protein
MVGARPRSCPGRSTTGRVGGRAHETLTEVPKFPLQRQKLFTATLDGQCSNAAKIGSRFEGKLSLNELQPEICCISGGHIYVTRPNSASPALQGEGEDTVRARRRPVPTIDEGAAAAGRSTTGSRR